MKILVTGCAGFIGYHLCNLFITRGVQVVGIDTINDYYDQVQKYNNLKDLQVSKNFKFIKLDIRYQLDLDTIPDDDIVAVFNLAAYAGVRYSLQQPKLYVDTNITGVINLLNFCKERKIKHFFYASSSSVYGLNTKTPFNESDLIENANSPYAITKIAGEQMCRLWHKLHGINTCGFRFFTVYGPRGRPDMAPFKFMKSIMNNQAITLYGDGSSGRDYTYVGDIATGLYESMMGYISHPDVSYCQIYNIGRGKPVKLLEFVKTIEKVTGKSAKIEWYPDQPGDVPFTYADTKKLEQFCGYRAQTDLYQGLLQTYEWMKMH